MSVPTGGGYYQAPPQISFEWLGKGWDYFKANPGAWVLALLLGGFVETVIFALAAIPTGVYAWYAQLIQKAAATASSGVPFLPPTGNPFLQQPGLIAFTLILTAVAQVFLGGYYRMALRQVRGEQITAMDLFAIMDVVLPLLAFGIIIGVVTTAIQIGLGVLLPGLAWISIIISYLIGGVLMFAPLVIVERGAGPIVAIRESITLISRQWPMAALFYFVGTLFAGLGAIACCVGMLVTYPMFIISVAFGYITFTQAVNSPPPPDYGQQQPGVWPPPPSGGLG